MVRPSSTNNVPILDLLRVWLKEQDPEILISSYNYNRWFCLDYGLLRPERIRLGGITLIYPDQGPRQAFQYDWDAKGKPDWHYRRRIWNINDPDAFPGILRAAYSIRDGKPFEWGEIFKVIDKKLIPVEGALG